MSGSGKALIAAAMLGLGLAARADVFSPGPLARAHENLEGLKNCTKCHVAGSKLSPDNCLACHTEIKERVDAKRGFHGLLAPADLDCRKCHHDHQGRDFQIVEWGKGGQQTFDHRKTGFVLEGKHAKASCASCHNDRMLGEAAVIAMRAKEPQRTTFLGAATQCSACHFDEHRGQLSPACKDCHNAVGWKPAPGFNHAKTSYPLEGKHASVECLKCHAHTLDADAHKDSPMPPRAEVFSRFRPVAHGSCTDCHKDPHAGRLGENCTGCHNVKSWFEMKAAGSERAFHEKTRYPLRGAHTEVACKSCHGPYPGVKAVFKGMRFGGCSDCHVDAHLGQLSAPAACDTCHTVQGFAPARYEPADHKQYPLQGAHRTAACSSCHRTDASLEAKAGPVRAFLEKRSRSDRISLVQFHPKGDSRRCDACHVDPHRSQFADRVKQSGCADCHQVESFAQVRFDHAKDSTFPLTGAHEKVACAACHVADAAGVVRYKPLSPTCAACHVDVHAGQFAPSPTSLTECTGCHNTSDWKHTSFVHRPPWTAFELEGKHATVDCAKCHRDVEVGGGVRARQYKGAPTTCAGCHVDVHKGAFREFKP